MLGQAQAMFLDFLKQLHNQVVWKVCVEAVKADRWDGFQLPLLPPPPPGLEGFGAVQFPLFTCFLCVLLPFLDFDYWFG